MNPFEVLKIKKGADKRDILQASAAALRERKFSGLVIALAQKQLLDAETKAELEFLYFVDLKPSGTQIPLSFTAQVDLDGLDMKRLEIFDE